MEEGSLRYQCKYCPNKFTFEENLKTHVKNRHHTFKINDETFVSCNCRKDRNYQTRPHYHCSKCYQTFQKHYLVTHIEKCTQTQNNEDNPVISADSLLPTISIGNIDLNGASNCNVFINTTFGNNVLCNTNPDPSSSPAMGFQLKNKPVTVATPDTDCSVENDLNPVENKSNEVSISNDDGDLMEPNTVSSDSNIFEKKLQSVYTVKNIDREKWNELLSKKTTTKDGKYILPRDWSTFIGSHLSKVNKYCCINFKRHFIPKKRDCLLEATFYCSIEGCQLNGKAVLYPNMELIVTHVNKNIRHIKNLNKSFRSRNIQGEQREVLKRKLVESGYPSKEFHKKLAKLDEESFSAGNLGDVGKSKDVYKQIKHEGTKGKQKDDKIVLSILALKDDYCKQMNESKPSGFIQFFSPDPFVVGMWCKKDVDFYHSNANSSQVLADATGGIACKVKNTKVYYYSYVIKQDISSEPLPFIEVLTDCHDERPLKWCLDQFLSDEKSVYGFNKMEVPLLFTCDMSWPIIKSALHSFNNESLSDYLNRSHRIVSGLATYDDLPINQPKTFVHLCLSHVMHSFARKVKNFFKSYKKTFIMYCCSVLANSERYDEFLENIYHLFIILIFEYQNETFKASYMFLNKTIEAIGYKKCIDQLNCNGETNSNTNTNEDTSDILEENIYDNLLNESKQNQQSKRSNFYKDSKQKFDSADKEKLENDNGSVANNLLSPKFAEYLLNNWTGLTSLWTNLHLNDQMKHGKGKSYEKWSNKYIITKNTSLPQRTQGIIELHQKITKNVTISSKNQRVDAVISDLQNKKISSHRYNLIAISKKKGKVPKVATENYSKRNKKKYSYQKSPSKANLSNLQDHILQSSDKENSEFSDESEESLSIVTSSPIPEQSTKNKTENPTIIKMKFKNEKLIKKKTQNKSKDKKEDIAESKLNECCAICSGTLEISGELQCFLCCKSYHAICAHPIENIFSIQVQRYVCPTCIYEKIASLNIFIYIQYILSNFSINTTFVDNQYNIWKLLTTKQKSDLEISSVPLPSLYENTLPRLSFQMNTNNGIENNHNICYISSVIQVLLGSVVNKYLDLTNNDKISKALKSCKNKLHKKSATGIVNLDKEFKLLSEKLMGTNYEDNIQHDAEEFMGKIISELCENDIFLRNTCAKKIINLFTCLTCNRIKGSIRDVADNLVLEVKDTCDPLSLESLLYSKLYCDIESSDNRNKCYMNCGGLTLETSTFVVPPKILIILTARNSSGITHCKTPVEVPATLHLDNYIIGDGRGVTYNLVACIYRYGNSLRNGHFNCAVFDYQGKAIVFDDKYKTYYSTSEVLLDEKRQKSTYSLIYMLEKSDTLQHYPENHELPWKYQDKALEKIKCALFDDTSFTSAITRQCILLAIQGKRLNDELLYYFLHSLKQKFPSKEIHVFCPLLYVLIKSWNNKLAEKELFKMAIEEKNLLQNQFIIVPINISNEHWALFVVHPQINVAVYLDSYLSFSNPIVNIEPVMKFLSLYCDFHSIKRTEWIVIIHDETPQQENNLDCGLYCCINAYMSITNEYLKISQNEIKALRYWIAYQCLTVKENPRRKSTLVRNTNKISFDKENVDLDVIYTSDVVLDKSATHMEILQQVIQKLKSPDFAEETKKKGKQRVEMERDVESKKTGIEENKKMASQNTTQKQYYNLRIHPKKRRISSFGRKSSEVRDIKEAIKASLQISEISNSETNDYEQGDNKEEEVETLEEEGNYEDWNSEDERNNVRSLKSCTEQIILSSDDMSKDKSTVGDDKTVKPSANTEVTIEDYYSSDDETSSPCEQLQKSEDLNKNTKEVHANDVLQQPKKQKLNVKSNNNLKEKCSTSNAISDGNNVNNSSDEDNNSGTTEVNIESVKELKKKKSNKNSDAKTCSKKDLKKRGYLFRQRDRTLDYEEGEIKDTIDTNENGILLHTGALVDHYQMKSLYNEHDDSSEGMTEEKCGNENTETNLATEYESNNDEYEVDKQKIVLKDYEEILRHAAKGDLVRTSVIWNYRYNNRKLIPSSKKHYRQLTKDIKSCGRIRTPLIMAIDMKIGRARINDGNHRIAIAKDLKMEWVPVTVIQLPIEKDRSEALPYWPRKWPFSYPCPCDFGFETQENKYGKPRGY